MRFEAFVWKGHEESSTIRQQDFDIFTHLITMLRRQLKKNGKAHDPMDVFSHGFQRRLQCGDFRKARYRVDVDVLSVPVSKRVKSEETLTEDKKIVCEDVSFGLGEVILIAVSSPCFACVGVTGRQS